jgi:hypothetical protein
MAATRAVVRARIQELLGDVNPAERVVNLYRLNEIINRNMQVVAAQTIRPTELATAITLVNGTYDYAIVTVDETQTVDQVFANGAGVALATGAELKLRTFVDMCSTYKQDTAAPVASGIPLHYTVYEKSDNVVTLRIGPTPNAAAVTARVSLIVRATGLITLPTTDASSIRFNAVLMRGLEAACAADVVEMLDDASLGALKISRGWAASLRRQAQEAIAAHNFRDEGLGRRHSDFTARSA